MLADEAKQSLISQLERHPRHEPNHGGVVVWFELRQW
jgi:hypothetical protein